MITPIDQRIHCRVINLMGEIKPQQFSDVMVALDVDTPGAEAVQLAGSEEG